MIHPKEKSSLKVTGKIVFVEDPEKIEEILNLNPMIKALYSGDRRPTLELFYMCKGTGEYYNLSGGTPKMEIFRY